MIEATLLETNQPISFQPDRVIFFAMMPAPLKRNSPPVTTIVFSTGLQIRVQETMEELRAKFDGWEKMKRIYKQS